jgi:hypothetical protein
VVFVSMGQPVTTTTSSPAWATPTG